MDNKASDEQGRTKPGFAKQNCRKAVYAIRFADRDKYSGFAMCCQLWNREDFKGLCYLTPPDRPHMIEGAVVKETKQGFVYKSNGHAPGEWEFKALTIENFRKQFYKLVIGGEEIVRSVETTEELYEWFNSRFPA